MKKLLGIICLCMAVLGTNVVAQEVDASTDKTDLISLTEAIKSEETISPSTNKGSDKEEFVSIHQININVPITRAEFIISIMRTTDFEYHNIMDTHYAMPEMIKAHELGLIDIDKYPVNTWSEIISNEEKSEILSNAMKNNGIDMGKVYTALSQVLVENVNVNGNALDLKGLQISHYKGQIMLPLRCVAESMGFKVTWNPETYSAIVENNDIKSEVEVGFDLYSYSSKKAIGMSQPFSAGAAPRLNNGVFYVPVGFFTMFSNVNIGNNTIEFTLK